VREELAGRLLGLYENHRVNEWRWYEESLTYCNAVLPHALLMCGQWIPNNDMTEAGLESLGWLADLQRSDTSGGHFVPIGSNGFYKRGGERARFDQQPVEAQAMVSACLEAHRITGDKSWHKEARRLFEWFLAQRFEPPDTIRPRAAVETVFTPTGQTKIRAPSLHLPFFRPCSSYACLRLLFNPWRCVLNELSTPRALSPSQQQSNFDRFRLALSG
jgi:hypothetical protein